MALKLFLIPLQRYVFDEKKKFFDPETISENIFFEIILPSYDGMAKKFFKKTFFQRLDIFLQKRKFSLKFSSKKRKLSSKNVNSPPNNGISLQKQKISSKNEDFPDFFAIENIFRKKSSFSSKNVIMFRLNQI